jgi:hypothetical protein
MHAPQKLAKIVALIPKVAAQYSPGGGKRGTTQGATHVPNELPMMIAPNAC